MNTLVAILNDGELFLYSRADNTYTEIELQDELASHNTGKSVRTYAICDSESFGAELMASGRSVFEVSPKTEVPGANTIIPPTGVTVAEIGDTDPVVHHP